MLVIKRRRLVSVSECWFDMPSIRAPPSKQTTTLSVSSLFWNESVSGIYQFWLRFLVWWCVQVVVKCRPLTAKERQRSRDIVRVINDKVSFICKFWFWWFCGRTRGCLKCVFWLNNRRSLYWILICLKTTLIVFRIELKRRNTALIMLMVLGRPTWYVIYLYAILNCDTWCEAHLLSK